MLFRSNLFKNIAITGWASASTNFEATGYASASNYFHIPTQMPLTFSVINIPTGRAGAASSSTGYEYTNQIVPTAATVKAIQKNRLKNKPTIRTNPLSYFSSSTYQLSLYMLTPDAYNAFYLSGYTNINNLTNDPKSGAYLLLQDRKSTRLNSSH